MTRPPAAIFSTGQLAAGVGEDIAEFKATAFDIGMKEQSSATRAAVKKGITTCVPMRNPCRDCRNSDKPSITQFPA